MPQNTHIRPVTEHDAAMLTALSAQFGYLLSEIETLENIRQVFSDKHHAAFVAYREGVIIGWIHVFKTFRIETKTFAEIGGLVVDEHFRKKGIGKMLVNKAKEWTKENGVDKLRVRSNVKRVETLQFYESLGFVGTKEQKVFEINIGEK